MSNTGVIIVGGGHGGFQAALSLRQQGYAEPVTLIGEEPRHPYQRPPLSKGMLLGKQQARHATLRPPAFYDKHEISLIIGERIVSLDREGRRVTGASGREFPYDTLILATGARNRPLPVEGADLEGVCYLRTIEEAEALDRYIESAENIVVIGGGFIGLEAAAAARARERKVTVLEAGPRLMGRAVAPQISQYFLERHRAAGVNVRLESAAEQLEGKSGTVHEVVLKGGERIPADLVLIGIGVIPNTELAAEAGLRVDNGIVVNEYLETEDPDIYSIGDSTSFPNPFAATADDPMPRIRLESVQNAVDQASSVARAITRTNTGDRQPYREAPWFWTTQFDVNLQMVGISAGASETVIRGNPESGKFSLFYFSSHAGPEGKLRAVDSINQPAIHLTARKLIASEAELTPQQAADEEFDLKSVL